MTTTTARPASRTLTIALLLLAAAIVAAVATSIVALAAHGAGAAADFPPLLPAVYLPFAIVGTGAAVLGWTIVARRARRPRRVLRVLIPVLLVLSVVPDLVLLATGFIPGSSTTAGVALLLMHPIVVGVAVPVAARITPAR